MCSCQRALPGQTYTVIDQRGMLGLHTVTARPEAAKPACVQMGETLTLSGLSSEIEKRFGLTRGERLQGAFYENEGIPVVRFRDGRMVSFKQLAMCRDNRVLIGPMPRQVDTGPAVAAIIQNAKDGAPSVKPELLNA